MIMGLDWLPGWWLPLAVAWPLLLSLAYSFGATRRVASALGPVAALPALAAAVMVTEGWSFFDWAYTGLSLDATGRGMLVLVSSVWLVAGRLVIPGPGSDTGALRTVVALMAMSGLFGAAMAEDAIVLISASTLAGYALAGLLACGSHPASVSRTRVLVGALVIGDLLLLEALLMLAHTAADIELSSLRAAFASSDERGLILAFVLLGLGVKVALAGVHVWLPAQLTIAGPGERLALLAFTFGAGLLGWLRLLPLGEIGWPMAAQVMAWGAWLLPAWALMTGVRQSRPASVLAYAMIATVGLWLALFSTIFGDAVARAEIIDSMIVSVIHIALALAVCLLLDSGNEVTSGRWRFLTAAGMLASGLWAALAVSLLAARITTVIGALPMVLYFGGSAVVLLMVVAGLRRHGVGHPRVRAHTFLPWLPMLLMTGTLLLTTLPELSNVTPRVLESAVMILTGAALAALLGTRIVPAPEMAAEGTRMPVRAMASLRKAVQFLMSLDTRRWPTEGLRRCQRIAREHDWTRHAARIQCSINQWPVVVILVALLGLAAAVLGRPA